VKIWRVSDDEASEAPAAAVAGRAPSSGRVRFTRATWPLSPSRYAVQVSGYPTTIVPVHAWSRTPIQVPYDLYREAIVLKPTVQLRKLVEDAKKPFSLLVWIKPDSGAGESISLSPDAAEKVKPFTGQAIFIGCDKSVHVPREVLERWRREEHYHPSWETPRYVDLGKQRRSLRPGDQVVVALQAPGGSLSELKRFNVYDYERTGLFPQEELIDEPDR
jgi:hypothetical protein